MRRYSGAEMPIKTKVESTGIFRRTTRSATSGDADAVRDLFDELTVPVDDEIRRAQREAKAFLKSHGLSVKWPNFLKLRNHAEPLVRDCIDVLFYGRFTLVHMQNGNVSDAIWCAMRFVSAHQRARLRSWEPLAISGKRSSDAGKKGRNNRQSKLDKWQAEADRIRRDNPGCSFSKSHLARLIAKKYDGNSDWIRQVIK